MSRGQLAVYAAAAIAVALIGARYLRESHGTGGASAGHARAVPVHISGGGGAAADGWATVQVVGEVRIDRIDLISLVISRMSLLEVVQVVYRMMTLINLPAKEKKKLKKIIHK